MARPEAKTQMTTRNDSTPGERAGSVELLWGLRAQPSRGPKPALSVERIARAAIEIADADGFAAISMQRVASHLGFTKMALYRHVADKAELLAVMIETAAGEPPDLESIPGGWRPKLEEWAHRLRASWQRHRWLPAITVGLRVLVPMEVGGTECAVGALAGTGLDGAEQMDAVFLLSGHIRNTQSATMAGTQPWTTERALSPAVTELLHAYGDRFHALIAAAGSAAGASRDNGWRFGLDRILDGLELLIAKRASVASVTPADS
jgi:AcrR family transcriptional regulator